MAQNKKLQKLELTWIGKDDERVPIEPRILIENPEYSYGDTASGNMLIHGDNLLALRALEQEYTSKVKCIYIDPPFNTGNAFEHYDDGLEHSIWLSLMRDRLKILKRLLTEDGFIGIHLDDAEMAYCRVIMDEVFGRNNYLNTITMTTNEPSGFKATSSSLFSTANYILLFAKNRYASTIKKVYIEKKYDAAYSKVLKNKEMPYQKWEYENITDVLMRENDFSSIKEMKSKFGMDVLNNMISDYAIKNSEKVFRTAAIGGGAKLKRSATIEASKKNKNIVMQHPNEDVPNFYILNGEQILFYSNRLETIDGELKPGQIITDVWTDISWTGIAGEGSVEFKNGKKPEKLVKRFLDMTTNPGDLVLDSFLGSGTTAAVAQKMGRKYIGIEMGNHAYTHCYKRLQMVTDGTDQGGISKAQGWTGGSGFRFYELAPSLLKEDRFGNLVINSEYNSDMLAAAMAKQEGYTYMPSANVYWKQGFGSESDYIYTTTQFLTRESLDAIHEMMAEGESLLICCKAFQPECQTAFVNITVKKIPQMLLGRCEFSKEDYSLNIVNLPRVEEEENL